MKFTAIHKTFLKSIIKEALKTGAKFIFNNSGRWDKKLPTHIKGKNIVIDVKKWTLENSYLKDSVIFIKTAFGDEEYSREFLFDDIISIISFSGEVLYVKTLSLRDNKSNIEESLGSYTLKGLLNKNS